MSERATFAFPPSFCVIDAAQVRVGKEGGREGEGGKSVEVEGYFADSFVRSIALLLVAWLERCWPAPRPPSNERMNECFLDPLMCAERLAERAADTLRGRERERRKDGLSRLRPRSVSRSAVGMPCSPTPLLESMIMMSASYHKPGGRRGRERERREGMNTSKVRTPTDG